jgi:hypothetical protein
MSRPISSIARIARGWTASGAEPAEKTVVPRGAIERAIASAI